MGAGFLFEWTDEWFKRTWNTEEHQRPGAERRQLWHDPLTNEQWFGVVATDSARVPDAARELSPGTGAVKYVLADADASYVHLDVTFRDRVPDAFTIAADAVRSVPGDDVRVAVSPAAGTAQVSVARALDPARLDGRQAADAVPDAAAAFHPFRLMVNRRLVSSGQAFPAEFQDVGTLRQGTWVTAGGRLRQPQHLAGRRRPTAPSGCGCRGRCSGWPTRPAAPPSGPATRPPG